MAQVGSLRPRLAVAKARLQVASRVLEGDRSRPVWHGWYKTARWAQLRETVFVRDGCTCRMCGCSTLDTSQLVADHVAPHLGDPSLFWDEGGVQTLCKACHDGPKQRAERRGW